MIIKAWLLTFASVCCALGFAQAGGATNHSGSFFPCEIPSPRSSPATSVHRLRPSDINVIGALGDSITSGFGTLAKMLFLDPPMDYRGVSWSGGGDISLSHVTTLPNIIRQYNPDLYGYAVGSTPIMNFVNLSDTGFNLARTGGFTEDLLSQAEDLVRKMRADERVDFENNWKMITILIGYNDLCTHTCTSDARGSRTNYYQELLRALDYMETNLPRTFVNVIVPTNLGGLQEQILRNTARGLLCSASFSTGCVCSPHGVASTNNMSTAESFNQAAVDFQQVLQNLNTMDRYNNSDSFTVVLQPFQTRIELDQTTYDISSFIEDCTHFSTMGMRDLATGLWQNLFEPVGGKSTTLSIPTEGLSCPPDGQKFFLTGRNGEVVNPVTAATAADAAGTTDSVGVRCVSDDVFSDLQLCISDTSNGYKVSLNLILAVGTLATAILTSS